MHESLKDAWRSVERYTPWEIQRRFYEVVRKKLLKRQEMLYKSEYEFHQYAKALFLETYNSVHELIDKKNPVTNFDYGRDAVLRNDNVLYHMVDQEWPFYNNRCIIRITNDKTTNKARIAYVAISEARDKVDYMVTSTIDDTEKFHSTFSSNLDAIYLRNNYLFSENLPTSDSTALLLEMDKELGLIHLRNILGENNLEFLTSTQTVTRPPVRHIQS
ncbi:MAG: hypothetical protein HYT11_03195 [Candidatus Levybacteria bacterium]|nr:hypothetical protein [Candidatus Levybacteria bacterium]